MRLRPYPLYARGCAAGRVSLVTAFGLICLLGATPRSHALLTPAQTGETNLVSTPGSPLLIGTGSSSEVGLQVLTPMDLAAFPWGHGASRTGLMSDSTRPIAGGPWHSDPGSSPGPTAHGLLLNFGPRTTLKAGLSRKQGRSSAWDERTEERKLEFATSLGAGGSNGLRLAMTSVDKAKGRDRSGTSTAEAHLNLAPASRLTVGADYVTKSSDSGKSTATQTVRTALRLAPEAEVSASLKRVANGGATATSESRVALSAALGCGKLKGEEKWSRSGGGQVASRAWDFSGGFGQGPGRTHIALDLRESRGERPEDKSTRKARAHLRRAVGSHLTLSAEYRENVGGTRVSPERQTETECGIEAKPAPVTKLDASLVTGRTAAGASSSRRRLGFAHQWNALQLRVDERTWQDGVLDRSLLNWSAEVPSSELPAWAKTIHTGHQFSDAKEYLLGKMSTWRPVEVPFIGFRLWGARRACVDDGEAAGLGFAHRRLVAGSLDLQIALEERPEVKRGKMEWQSLPVRRSSVSIGRRLTPSLNARCGYGLESGLDSPGSRLEQVGLAIWGELPDGRQIEGSVSHESGQWEGEERLWTQISLLYSHPVDEEHHVEVKLGYAWGEGVGSGASRTVRLTLGYQNPL